VAVETETVTASVLIAAEPAEVFEYFTKAEAMVSWMGQFAHLDPRPGGRLAIDINGAAVRGEYRELEPPHRLVFSWGFAGSEELPAGSSTVEVLLVSDSGGTRVDLIHSGLPESERARHAHGWRHFLGRLAAMPLTRAR
jgi:uncharacterized protein YndB with AHSA1/START domain